MKHRAPYPQSDFHVHHIFSAQSSVVITVNQGVRGGKVTELKRTVDTAVQSCPTVRQVFVAMRTENPVVMTARDVAMEEVRDQKSNQDPLEDLNANSSHIALDK